MGTEHGKQFINAQRVGYKHPEYHCLMSPQGTVTLGLSGVTDKTPATPYATPKSFLFDLILNICKFLPGGG